MGLHDFVEEIEVAGRDLVGKVKSLIHEGNVQRIIVKDERGNTFLEIPVTVAVISTILAPILSALGALTAFAAHFKIVIVRAQSETHDSGEKQSGA